MHCLWYKEEKKCENIDLIVGFLFEDNEIIQHFWQRLILAKELSITKNFFSFDTSNEPWETRTLIVLYYNK